MIPPTGSDSWSNPKSWPSPSPTRKPEPQPPKQKQCDYRCPQKDLAKNPLTDEAIRDGLLFCSYSSPECKSCYFCKYSAVCWVADSGIRKVLTPDLRKPGYFWRITTTVTALRPLLPSVLGIVVTFEAIFDDFARVPSLIHGYLLHGLFQTTRLTFSSLGLLFFNIYPFVCPFFRFNKSGLSPSS